MMVWRQDRHAFNPVRIHTPFAATGYRDLITALCFGDGPNIDSDTAFGGSNSLIVQEKLDLPGSLRPEIPRIRDDFALSRTTDQASARMGSDPSRLMPAG